MISTSSISTSVATMQKLLCDLSGSSDKERHCSSTVSYMKH
jgi:hypothetical protein